MRNGKLLIGIFNLYFIYFIQFFQFPNSIKSSSDVVIISDTSKVVPLDLHYQYQRQDTYNNDRYQFKAFIQDGTFGRLLTVQDKETNSLRAMKIIKSGDQRNTKNGQIEYEIVNKIHVNKLLPNHPGRNKIVTAYDSFFHGENFCIVFEELGLSLYDCLKQNCYKGYTIWHIQKILSDILQGLDYMHSINLTHTDLKPENIVFQEKILFQNKQGFKYPYRFDVKIIDLGGAQFDDEKKTRVINTRQYRAPEVIMQCIQWTTSSDMWSLACLVLELFTGDLYYDTRNYDYEHLAMIEKTCGPIPKAMIQKAIPDIQQHFDLNQTGKSFLKWPIGVSNSDNIKKVKLMKTINEIIPKKFPQFTDLIKKMMVLDPKQRITASQALNHQFFSCQYQYV